VTERHSIPRPAVKFPAIPLLEDPTPLLEEEREMAVLALLPYLGYPRSLHWSSAGT